MIPICTKTKTDAGSQSTYFQKLLALFLIKGYEAGDFRCWVEKTNNDEFKNIIFEDEIEKVLVQINWGRKSDEGGNFEKYFNPNEDWKEYIDTFIKMKTNVFANLENVLKEAEQSENTDNIKSIRSRLEEIWELFYNNYEEYKNKISLLEEELNSIKTMVTETVYKELKSFLKQELYVVFTNINVNDGTILNNNLFIEECFDQSFILRSDDIFVYYNFNTNQSFNNLSRTNIPIHVIKHFLEKFRVVSVPEQSIYESVQEAVFNNKMFNNVSDISICDKFCKNVSKCFKSEISKYKQMGYFGRIHFLSFLSELWNTNLKEKLSKYVKKLNFKQEIIKDRFWLIVKTNRKFLVMLKLLQELNKKQETGFLFVDADLDVHFQCHMIDAFELPKYKYLVCALSSSKSKVLLERIEEMSFKIVSQSYKKIILLTAEDVSIRAAQTFDSIDDQELFNNCTKNEVDKTKSMDGALEESYVSRNLILNNGEPINENKFLETVLEGKNKIILLSDLPGMGKTALFRHLSHTINNNHFNLWAIHIEINHYIKELNNINHNIPTLETLLKIEDDFEREILTLPEKVIVFVDSLEEIIPENKELFFRFITSLRDSENIKLLFIASRPNNQQELENSLGITAYKMLEFSGNDCVEFICKYWKSIAHLQSESDSCQLVRILDPFIKIKTPLDIRIIAEIYKKDQIQLDKITYRYRKFFEIKKEELIREKYPKEQVNNNRILQKIVKILSSKIADSLENLAVRMLISENKFKFLDIDIYENYPLLWESLRSVGLTKYYNGVYQLEQRVFAEYLVAQFVWKQFNSENNLLKDFVEYFIRDIVEEPTGKYYTVRSFLNELLETEWDCLSPTVLDVCSSVIDSRVNTRVNNLSINLNLSSIIQDNHTYILKLLFNRSKECQRIINTTYFLGHNALYLAHKNLNMLKFLNTMGGDLNKAIEDPTGNKLIHIVNDCKTIEYLVSEGVDINSVNSQCQTALHQATLQNDVTKIKCLTGNKADVNFKDINGLTPLDLAVKNGAFETVKYLCENGANVNFRKPKVLTIMHNAALGGNLKIYTYLEEFCEKDRIFIDEFERNSLHHAVFGSNINIVKSLIKEEEKSTGTFFLNGNLYGKNSDILKYLIEHKALIGAKTNSGETVLHRAAVTGNLDIVKYLINQGANINAKTSDGRTVLHQAVTGSNLEVVKYLINFDMNINAKTKNDETVLHRAAVGGNLDIVKYLVKEKLANLSAKTKKRRTVLHQAVTGGNSKVVEYFINLGMDVNATTIDGETPLHLAINGQLEVVKILYQNNADINIEDNEGNTPIDKAFEEQRLDILSYFCEESERNPRKFLWKNDNVRNYLSALAKIAPQMEDVVGRNNQIVAQQKFVQGNFPKKNNTFQYVVEKRFGNKRELEARKIEIDDALWKNHLDIIKYLAQSKTLLNKRDIEGKTALHYAVLSGHFEIVKLLIENECDINVKDKNGLTALHYAADEISIHINSNTTAQIVVEQNLKVDIRFQSQINPKLIFVR